MGELGCRTAYRQAILNARNFIYLEDQYFVEPELVDLLKNRLTDPDPKQRVRRAFVIVPHILADQDVINDAVYHHKRREHMLLIQEAVRNMIATERSIAAATVPGRH